MRIAALILGVLLGAHFVPPVYADGEGPPTFRDRPQVGQPVRFTDSVGHVFQPDRLVILTAQGARAAVLPETTNRARSEEHLDLSGLPLLGHLFQDRLAPGDAKRRGVLVSPVTRMGKTLVVDGRQTPVALEPREIVLTANFPRQGAVSYWLGRRSFSPVTPPAGPARLAGTAWLVGNVLVLAGPGYGPGIENLEGAIGERLR